MSKKKIKTSLNLNKKTIKVLNDLEMSNVNGKEGEGFFSFLCTTTLTTPSFKIDCNSLRASCNFDCDDISFT